MLNKKTILFFTDRYNTEVAENIQHRFGNDNSIISVLITEKELESRSFNKLIDKIIPEETGTRYKIRNLRTAMSAHAFGRTKGQKVIFNHRSAKQNRILNALHRYNPCVIVVTSQSVLSDSLAAVDRYGGGIKTVVVAEDFVLDKRLVHRSADLYFVDNYDMRSALIREGIPEDKIEIAGLPVADKYFTDNDVSESKKKFALESNKPTVLVSASRIGDNRFKKVLERIKKEEFDFNLIVACGKNRSFINFIRDLGYEAYNEGIDMNAALNACDFLIARPTTMLMAEAIVKKKKILTLLPNGKLEEGNMNYLALDTVEKFDDEESLVLRMQQLLNPPEIQVESIATQDTDTPETENVDSQNQTSPVKEGEDETQDQVPEHTPSEPGGKVIAARVLELAKIIQEKKQQEK